MLASTTIAAVFKLREWLLSMSIMGIMRAMRIVGIVLMAVGTAVPQGPAAAAERAAEKTASAENTASAGQSATSDVPSFRRDVMPVFFR
ncbi:MAG: hypothetical protein HQ464_12105, partial [Planctomycetes bacterium]|nr:hypothetical protein [Planctomycetota bacterium]